MKTRFELLGGAAYEFLTTLAKSIVDNDNLYYTNYDYSTTPVNSLQTIMLCL